MSKSHSNLDRAVPPEAAALHHVSVTYAPRGRSRAPVRALVDVSLTVPRGKTLGIVGESGSGKTTIGRLLLGLQSPTSGRVEFDGRRMPVGKGFRRLRGKLQVVLQNPDWSLNPSLRVWRSVAEPLIVAGSLKPVQRREMAREALLLVGMDQALADRKPHELSGGQRQRVAIARAIVADPTLIVFDEAVTALDVSVQAQILNLIKRLQAERGFSSVFISHDLAAVRYVADEIAVVYQGEVVEHGPSEGFYTEPQHPYTRTLFSALPTLNPKAS